MKALSADQRNSLTKDVEGLNLSRYVSEVVDAVAENKLKSADVPVAVHLCSLMHQRWGHLASYYLRYMSLDTGCRFWSMINILTVDTTPKYLDCVKCVGRIIFFYLRLNLSQPLRPAVKYLTLNVLPRPIAKYLLSSIRDLFVCPATVHSWNRLPYTYLTPVRTGFCGF